MYLCLLILYDLETVWDPLRKKEVALTPEERVRQWFIGILREEMEVPAHMMMSEASFMFGGKRYRADIIVYGRDASPVAVVECKRPETELDGDVLYQAVRYNMVLAVRYIIITNGRATRIFRRESGGFRQTGRIPVYSDMTGGTGPAAHD